MTHDPSGQDIPGLINDLERSLTAPDPAAIRAGLGARQSARKRILGVAGAFVAVLAIAGGTLALTNNDETTTETAADGLEAQRAEVQDLPSVADDSAPFETEGPMLSPTGSIRDQMIGTAWTVGAVRGDAGGFESQSGWIRFNADPGLYDVPADLDTVLYTNGCSGSAYVIEWVERIDFPQELGLRNGATTFRVISELPIIPVAPSMLCRREEKVPVLVEGPVTVGQAEGADVITMGVLCPPLAVCSPEGFWTVDLIDEDAVVPVPEEPNTSADQRAEDPPEFAPSEDIALSGEWELVGLWSDGEAVDLSEFARRSPSVIIFGREYGGYDGCNSHGGGTVAVTAEGTIRFARGRSTLVGCPDVGARGLFSQASSGTAQWGRTSYGNLVLSNRDVTAEFARAMSSSQSVAGFSAPVRALWSDGEPPRWFGASPAETPVQIAIGDETAVLSIEGCGEVLLSMTRTGFTEGAASIAVIDQECEPTGDAADIRDALLAADYYAVGSQGFQVWSGLDALVRFADRS